MLGGGVLTSTVDGLVVVVDGGYFNVGGGVLTSTVDGLVVVVDGGYFNVGGGGEY